jgi:hypothetical protein
MYTLFDFITRIKGIEYIIAILFIAAYVLYVEALKPAPFATLLRAARETRDQLRKMGYSKVLGNVGKIVAMPLIGLAYLIALPFAFVFAVGSVLASKVWPNLGGGLIFGWRPTEAYLAGKKRTDSDEKN